MTELPQSIVQHAFEFQLWRLPVTGFGIAMLLAFLVAQTVAQSELQRRGKDPNIMADVVVAAVIGGLLGGKIYYAILTHRVDALFDRAGFVFWGGLAGGILASAILILWKKQS